MDKELSKLIYGGILDEEEIEALGNLGGIDVDQVISDEEDVQQKQRLSAKRGRKPRKASFEVSAKSEEQKSSAAKSVTDEDQMEEDLDIKSSKSFSIESDSEDLEESKSQSEVIDSDIKSSRSLTPLKAEASPRRRGRVQFLEDSEEKKNYKGIDLSVLLKTRNEIVYKLTELYLPNSQAQRAKMINYNKEKMITQNDVENEGIRAKRRKAKEEIKSAKAKLRHQIKYCNPAPLLDDVNYLYREGVTSKHIDYIKERKYQNAPHIAKVLPSKRPMNQALIDQQKDQTMLQLQEINGSLANEGSQIKSYLIESKNEVQAEPKAIEWDKDTKFVAEVKDASVIQYIQQEKTYEQVCQKIFSQDLSIADLNEVEKKAIKLYLKRTCEDIVDSKYPKVNMKPVERQVYQFVKNLNTQDFSYKGQKSALQSDDHFFEDLIGSTAQNGSLGAINFGNQLTDDKTSMTSDPFSINHNNIQKSQFNDQNEVSDAQLQQWYIDQRYKVMSQYQPTKRRKYWGEPSDCQTLHQQNLDNFQYKKFQNKQYIQRGNREEKVFKVEKVFDNKKLSQKGAKPETQAQNTAVETPQLKDIMDYEFLKNQEHFFYEDLEKKTNVNNIMRNIQRELGMITEEEFLAQEELADQIEASTTVSVSKSPSYGKERLRDKNLELERRKERVCDEFIDNFDFHFERRKKDLHEHLLRKIHTQEKAHQQTTATQQTVAYASGSHALLQAAANFESNYVDAKGDQVKSLVNMNKLREEKDWMGDQHRQYMIADEEMVGEETAQQKQGMHPEGMIEENMRLRVTKSRAYELNHAKCILKLSYTKFDWTEKALNNFHRTNIQDIFDQFLYEAEVDLEEKQRIRQKAALPKSNTSIVLGFQGYPMVVEKPDDQTMLPEKIVYSNLPIHVISMELIEKRVKKSGIINAHEYFKDRFKLSLRDGKFCMFEHLDQNPLFINNFGMASKLKRYVYADKFLPPSAFLKRQENVGTRHMGPHGVQILKKKGEKIPLLGQIDTKQWKGITVMENNMSYIPAFYHKPLRNDFLCVVHKDKRGNNSIIVREIQDIYSMGQEEPKMEVYNPQSRQYQHFIKRRTQAYIIRFLQENNNYISFVELNRYFPYINDQILKKIMKEINVEVDRHQYCSLTQEYNDEQFRSLVTPENICQYESAQFGEQMLKKVGIQEITNADKISYATNKFCSEEPDQKKQLVARIIEEEVLSTPWNLSQNFIHNRQTRGMMMLEGIGDPSNGHGGYSYLKLPLKISQDSLNKAKINRMYLNPAIQNPKAVTGTDADLRKLSKKEIKQKLLDLGFKDEQIHAFTRWEMVALLRDRSSQAVSLGQEGDMKKFARGVRFTSKKQREMYQRQVNDIFKKQMNYLSKENADFISDFSDNETRADQSKKKVTDLQQMNSSYHRNTVEVKEDIEITNIKDIPNYEMLLMASQPLVVAAVPSLTQPPGLNIGGNSAGAPTGIDLTTGNIDLKAAAEALKQRLQEGGMTLSCTVLRKRIKPVSGEDRVERVIFVSDPRQIKGFNKRKHKHEVKTKRTKKTSLKEKMQIAKPRVQDVKERGRCSETSSVVKQSQSRPEESDIKIKIGGGTADQSINEGYSESNSQLALSLGSKSKSRSRGKAQKKSLQRYSSQLNMAQKPLDQISMDSSGFSYNQPNQKPTVTINLKGLATEQKTEQRSHSKDNKKKLNPKKSSKVVQSAYREDDFELYKPKTLSTRRRQVSVETSFNEALGSIVDSCIHFDTSKIFLYPVKKKDAPTYQNVIKEPMELQTIKNQTKRGEYVSLDQFLHDITLIRQNAEFFNGLNSYIAQMARDLEDHANQQVEEAKNNLESLEMLVKERISEAPAPII